MNASQFIAEVDAIVAATMGNAAESSCCSKGCSTCCSEPLYIDEMEIEYMLEGVPPDKMEGLKARAVEWLEKFQPFVNADTQNGLINSYPYLEADIKCPFLEGNLCSVYDRRPMSCRTFFAKENPEHCKMPHRQQQKYAVFDMSRPVWGRLWLSYAQQRQRLYLDHLGIHLTNKLFGTSLETSVSHMYEFH